MKVTANGKTFTFPDGTSTDDIGSAIDEYFAGQTTPAQQGSTLGTPAAQPTNPVNNAPSMLDNAEQAARGLVNIPFDVLQGGASLINAISQGLGGPKVLDDVYRPVDRPTDPYAQAGETIGGYLTPGLGMAGNMALGSLAEAGNQGGDFAQNAATNAAVNLGAQGLLSAAVNGIGKVVRGARGTPAVSQVTQASSPAEAIIDAAPSPSAQAESARAAQGVTEAINPMPTEDAVRRMASQKNPNLASSLEGLDIKPQLDVIQAADRLGVDSILPSHISGNEQYQAVEQAIKSRAGSSLKVQENEAIRELAAGAGKIIDDVAGAPDALGMSERFIDTVNGRMSALQRRSDQLYSAVDKAMPPSTRIEAPNTKDMLKGVADELGGSKNLDPIEKRVFQAVNPGEKDVLTYANLNKQRRLVGDALHKNSGPYKDADRAALSRLYGSLSEDQKAALSGTESLRDFEIAQRLVQMRKSMEEQMVNLRGKTLNGDVAYKATNALQAMSKGNGKGFRELMDSTPSRQLRTELIGSGLRDMLSSGKRGADFNPGGFADWYQNMMASGQMRNIAKYLPKKTMAGLNDTYKVARAIQVAKSQELQTGKLVEFVERFNRVTAPLEMAASHAQRAGTMIGSTIGGPVGAVAGSEIGQRLASRVRASGGAGSADAAEKLISSPEFQRALKMSASKAPGHVVDSSIRRSPYWRRFYDSLNDSDKKTIARMGMLYWLGQYDADSQ